jgi:hypothetical protein
MDGNCVAVLPFPPKLPQLRAGAILEADARNPCDFAQLKMPI